MPLRGESIGTAYVRVLADGTGLADSVRDEFRDADGAFEDAGSVGAKAYKKKFTEEIEQFDHDAFGRRLDNAFNKALIDDELAERVFQGPAWRKLERNLIAKWGDAGRDASEQMRRDFLRSGSIQGLERDVEGVVGRINRNLDRAFANTARTADGAVESLRKTKVEVDKDEHVFIRLAAVMDRIANGTGRAFGKGSRNDFLNFIGSFVAGSLRMLGLLPRLLGNLGEFASGFKTAFKASEGFFSSLRAGFTRMSADAEGGATAMSQLISAGIIGFPLLIAAMVGFVAILSIVASLISGIVAALIALTSTVAFGLVGALAPIVGLIAPILVSVGGLVLLIQNLTNNSKEFKQAFRGAIGTFESLGDSAREGFLQTFNIEKAMRAVEDAVRHLHPLVNDLGEAFGDVATDIADGFSSPEWRRFVNTMETLAPFVVRKLGSIAGNVTAALLNIFTILDPFVRRFLRWLESITQEFQNWTNDKAGRDDIKQFFEDAAESAEILGDFLGEVVEFVSILLGGGKGTGDTLFQDMTDNLDKFNKFLKENPDALDDFFKNGKETAEQIGDIAVSLGEIFDALDSPEGRKNLHALLDALTALSKLAGPLSFLSNGLFDEFKDPLGIGAISDGVGKLRGLGVKIDSFKDKFSVKPGFAHGLTSWIPGAIGASARWVRNATSDVGRFLRAFHVEPGFAHGLVAWIPGALSDIDRFATGVNIRIDRAMTNLQSRVRTAAGNAVEQLRSIPGRLGGLTERFAVAAAGWTLAILRQFGQLPDQIVGFFRGLGGRIADAIGSIPLHFDFPDAPSWLQRATGPLRFLDPRTASGGIFTSAAARVIGEAGPEAVVPLDRDLSQVDPAVRWLSALAQGKSMAGLNAVGVGGGKTINNEWNITQTTQDPVAAANELLNRMVHAAM